jgi:pimeloyl-ACP methyl ester carboxylesterase
MTRVQPKVKVETKVALGQCPIAIIHGGKDKLISINESKRLMKALERHGQHGELFAIESCGHVPHEEIPEDFTEVLLKSLRFGSEVSIKSDE